MPQNRAIGLPDPNINSPFPESRFQTATLSVQEHLADKAGPHLDLRIAMSQTGVAHSWALPQNRLPNPGEKLLAVQSGDHNIDYQSYSGEITDGYGKGKVNLKIYDKIEILESDENKVTFNYYKGTETQRYSLIRIDGKNWLILNTTPTRLTRPEIPQSKRSYKSLKEQQLNLRDPNLLLAPKIDGGMVVLGLRPNRRIDVFSYRPSKRGTNLIDHSAKTNLYKYKTPQSVGKTILRGEIYGIDKKTHRAIPSAQTGGLLNSSTQKSREIQQQRGQYLDHLIFDIDTFKGRDVSNEPYGRKLQLLKYIKQEMPELNIVEPARSYEDKLMLLEQIKSRKHPLTQEGVVAYDLLQAVPQKVKFREDADVYFSHPFAPKSNSRLEQMGAAGGFWASRQPGGPANIRVGTGFNDKQRIEIMQNPSKYKNMPAKILTHEEFASGKLRVPTFKEWRYEQWEKTSADRTQVKKINPVVKPPIPDPRIKLIRDYLTSKLPVELATIKSQGKVTQPSVYSTIKKTSSVIDPPQPTLDTDLWDLNTLTLHPYIKLAIFKALQEVLGHDTKYVSAVKLLGAQTTYNYIKGHDIDVNVGFFPQSEDPGFIGVYADLFKRTNPHYAPGLPNEINLFAVVDSGKPQQYDPVNVLALYDLFTDTWIKKPDIGGFDTSDDQQLISPYTTIYTSALKRALKSYEKHPDSQSNIMYLIELYKHLDHDRKLSYQYGWGVPNVEDENLSYKRILRDIPNSKEIEQLYHKNKSKLLKGWLNI